MLHSVLEEVVCAWDEREGLLPGPSQLWSPYDQYDKVNCKRTSTHNDGDGNSAWQLDQMRNVRRVMHRQLDYFAAHESMRATAALVKALESACERAIRQGAAVGLSEAGQELKLSVYDLHFLRQRGTNAASFSPHQDLHDTGNAATTRVAAAVSVLIGGWGEAARPPRTGVGV